MEDVQGLISQFEGLQGSRSNWDTMWQQVHDLVWPFSGDFTREQTPGERRTHQIYDTTNAQAIETFGAVLESLLTPRNQRFHSLKPSDSDLMKEKRVAVYFDDLNTRLFQLRGRPRAGFYDQAFESFKSLGAYGNQCFNAVPSKDRRGISYCHRHVGAVWIELDDRGIIDTIFFRWKMSAKASLQQWGERAPEIAKRLMEKEPYKLLPYLHVVKPRKEVNPNVLGPESMLFESWEISLEDRSVIPWENPFNGQRSDAGGFNTNPYIYSRFSVNPSEKHGRGPSMFVLGDNETLQRMSRSGLLYGEHAVAPPLLSQNMDLLSDGSSDLDLRSEAVNPGWLDAMGRPRVQPLQNGYNFQINEAMMERQRSSINQAHFITLFQILVQSPEMTATEALIRAQEKGQLIAPMVGRQQGEFLGPLIERELSIMADLDLMPEMPEELIEAEGEYEIEYSSSATRIQREEEVQSIRATFVDMAGIAEVDPTAVEVLDAPGSVRFIAEARGVPQHLIRSDREFKEIVSAQAQRAEQQEAIANAQPLAAAAKDLSQATAG